MNDSNGGAPPKSGFLRGGWSPAIRDALERMVVEHRGGLAALDFDDTIIDGDVSVALLRDMDRNDPRELVAEYEADCAKDVRYGYARLVETLIGGRTELEVRDHVRAVLERGLADGSLRIRPELRELIWALQRYGWTVYVVTASPAVVIHVAAQQVGVPSDHVLGMWCAPGPDGRFLRPTREPITYRQGKVDALLAATGGRTPDFAVGDAMTDLEMLGSARYALVLDKGSEPLRNEATARGWWLQGGL
ncbi:MAG: haloacid dehalogenase-like hydrolase [Alphaproteobacteria bacterium]|nr:haloacid dehalogenase-like hydrolase [Alphaproteobacteria bacterium]